MTKIIPVKVAMIFEGKDYLIEVKGFKTKADGLVLAPSQNPKWKYVLIHASSGFKIGHFSNYKNTLFNLAKSVSHLDWSKSAEEIQADKIYRDTVHNFYWGNND